MLVAALGFVGGGPRRGHDWLVLLAAEVFVGVPAAAIVLVMGRPRLVLDDDGLTVRGYASTRHLAWEEVRSFQLQRVDPCLVADVRGGGKPVPIHALRFNPRRSADVAKAEAIRDELNGLLAERRGG